VTAHDGFTLNDLVSYERKHNHANGEVNRDGENNNYSVNCGVEGPTRRRAIVQLRQRQAKNMLSVLLLSNGVPMVVSGDEVLRTQRGNNNAYCQDNSTSWFDWRLLERNPDMLRFFTSLVAFRNRQPSVRRGTFLTGQSDRPNRLPDVGWFGPGGRPVDWHTTPHSLTCIFGTSGLDDPRARNVMIMLHAGAEPQSFVVPSAAAAFRWRLFIDTEAEPPGDIFPECDGPFLKVDGETVLADHSLRCFVAES
jgi:glycogen operon protein